VAEALVPADTDRIRLDSGWIVDFGDGGSGPVELPDRWEADPDRIGFSGTAEYRTGVDLDESWVADAGRLVLDFGPVRVDPPGSVEADGMRGNSYRVAASTPVRDVVEVIVNGRPCGVVWRPPYRIEIGAALRPGRNEIVLRVSNTAANALSQDTAIARIVATSRRQYGRRFQMQDLDRAMDGISSGLLTVPVIRRLG
jgi:hypothetical protein